MSAEHNAIRAAVKLLIDNHLVWSSDFELVRPFLLGVLMEQLAEPTPRLDYVRLAKDLVRAT